MENLIAIVIGALVGHVGGFIGKKQMYKTYLALAFFIMCGAVFVNEVIPVARELFMLMVMFVGVTALLEPALKDEFKRENKDEKYFNQGRH